MKSDSRRGLATTHLILLLGVSALLGTLTLSRVQLFAVYENERDAVALLERLGGTLSVPGASSDPDRLGRYDLRAAVERAGLTVGNPTETSWLEDGRVLRRRGYLFDVVTGGEGNWLLRAWPWNAGATGVAAYAFEPSAGLLGHHNRAEHAGEPLWSGPKAAVVGPFGQSVAPGEWIALEDSRRLALASRMP